MLHVLVDPIKQSEYTLFKLKYVQNNRLYEHSWPPHQGIMVIGSFALIVYIS